MSAHSQDIGSADFQRVVIEGSSLTPVLVDFWAPWCGPCRTLTPVLEKLAEAYAGKFVLAKLNSDDNQELARQFGVRSIPNVKAFVDGKLVDEFMGAVPESAVREFIERLLPSPAELQRREAQAALAAGETERALQLLDSAALLEPSNDRIHADRVELLLTMERVDEAREAAARFTPLAARDARVGQLLARLQFAAAGDTTSAAKLAALVNADPGDLDARLKLAKLLTAQQNYELALEHLLQIIQRDRKFGDDAGRKTMLAVFDLLEGKGELVAKYRKLLAAAINR